MGSMMEMGPKDKLGKINFGLQIWAGRWQLKHIPALCVLEEEEQPKTEPAWPDQQEQELSAS